MRVKTGIPGLDPLLQGGIPRGNVVLLSGGTGSGKTVICSQFIAEGVKRGEPGLFISLEEGTDQIISNMKLFGLDMADKGIDLVNVSLHNFDVVKDEVRALAEEFGAKRLVIDPITQLGLFFERSIEVRRGLVELIGRIKKLGITTLLTTEIKEGSAGISSYGVEEFVVDGVIVLRKISRHGARLGALEILKMRGTDHERVLHPYEITKQGVVVYPDQSIFE